MTDGELVFIAGILVVITVVYGISELLNIHRIIDKISAIQEHIKNEKADIDK